MEGAGPIQGRPAYAPGVALIRAGIALRGGACSISEMVKGVPTVGSEAEPSPRRRDSEQPKIERLMTSSNANSFCAVTATARSAHFGRYYPSEGNRESLRVNTFSDSGAEPTREFRWKEGHHGKRQFLGSAGAFLRPGLRIEGASRAAVLTAASTALMLDQVGTLRHVLPGHGSFRGLPCVSRNLASGRLAPLCPERGQLDRERRSEGLGVARPRPGWDASPPIGGTRKLLSGCHAVAGISSQRYSLWSLHTRCMTTASLRATATLARRIPIRLASASPQVFKVEGRRCRDSSTVAASNK